jgi:hypothetical protein
VSRQSEKEREQEEQRQREQFEAQMAEQAAKRDEAQRKELTDLSGYVKHYYDELVAQGFSSGEAFALVRTWQQTCVVSPTLANALSTIAVAIAEHGQRPGPGNGLKVIR